MIRTSIYVVANEVIYPLFPERRSLRKPDRRKYNSSSPAVLSTSPKIMRSGERSGDLSRILGFGARKIMEASLLAVNSTALR